MTIVVVMVIVVVVVVVWRVGSRWSEESFLPLTMYMPRSTYLLDSHLDH